MESTLSHFVGINQKRNPRQKLYNRFFFLHPNYFKISSNSRSYVDVIKFLTTRTFRERKIIYDHSLRVQFIMPGLARQQKQELRHGTVYIVEQREKEAFPVYFFYPVQKSSHGIVWLTFRM